MSDRIRLGMTVREKLTGIIGVVVGKTEYLTGCTHAAIQPRELNKDGKPADWEHFDIRKLEWIPEIPILGVTEDGMIELPLEPEKSKKDKAVAKQPGGPQPRPLKIG